MQFTYYFLIEPKIETRLRHISVHEERVSLYHNSGRVILFIKQAKLIGTIVDEVNTLSKWYDYEAKEGSCSAGFHRLGGNLNA